LTIIGGLSYWFFGVMDGNNKVGRPHREWVDDIVDWCGAGSARTELLCTRQNQMCQTLTVGEPKVYDDDDDDHDNVDM